MWCNEATFQSTMEDEPAVTQLFCQPHGDRLWWDEYSYRHPVIGWLGFWLELKLPWLQAAVLFYINCYNDCLHLFYGLYFYSIVWRIVMHPLPFKQVVGLLLKMNSVHKHTHSTKYHCMVMAVVTTWYWLQIVLPVNSLTGLPDSSPWL